MKSPSRRKTSTERRDELFAEMMRRDRTEKESAENAAREQQERRDLLVRALAKCDGPIDCTGNNGTYFIIYWRTGRDGNTCERDPTGLPIIDDDLAEALARAMGETGQPEKGSE